MHIISLHKSPRDRAIGLKGVICTVKYKGAINLNGQSRANISPGTTVDIVLKQDQRTGKLTRGIVKDLLTNSQNHPRGIKVRLLDGQVGRVQEIIK